jgi:hypothetical protein
MENGSPPPTPPQLLRGPWNYARCAINEASCSKSPYLIIEFSADYIVFSGSTYQTCYIYFI